MEQIGTIKLDSFLFYFDFILISLTNIIVNA